MAKVIAPNELAEIVTGLLINPALLGELDSVEQHQAFMEGIAQVVADHCGGHVNGVSEPDNEDNYLADEYSSPYVSVSPDDSLPSLHRNAWALHDPEGWEDDLEGELAEHLADDGEPLTSEYTKAARKQLQALLIGEPQVAVMVVGGMVESAWSNIPSTSLTILDDDNERNINGLTADEVQAKRTESIEGMSLIQ